MINNGCGASKSKNNMKFTKTGLILYTINYQKCVHFYGQVLGLKILYKKDMLTCFDFHGSYLMVEVDDESGETASVAPKRDRMCLRINVPNVKRACETLDRNGIAYNYYEYDWGTIAKFRDPDGNLIGYRSAEEHQRDIDTSR